MIANMTAWQSRSSRTGKYRKPVKGFWYWAFVFPIKWIMIIEISLVGFMLVASFSIIAVIPWIIVRSIQGKSLKPDFLEKAKKTPKSE